MPKIRFTTSVGDCIEVDAAVGESVMQAATRAVVPGIDAECGGGCACGTCHVRVAAEWQERVGPPNVQERGLLEFLDEAGAGSRLSCQIPVSEALDGLELTVLPAG